MNFPNLNIHFSEATRRDFRSVTEAFWEMVDDFARDPWMKLGGIAVAVLVAAIMLLPWLADDASAERGVRSAEFQTAAKK